MSVTTEKTKRKRNKGGNLLLPGMTELPKPKVREIRTPEKTKDNKDIDKLANSESDLTNNIDKLQEYSEKTTKFDRHVITVSYTHLRAHETVLDLVCRLLLEKKKRKNYNYHISHKTPHPYLFSQLNTPPPYPRHTHPAHSP